MKVMTASVALVLLPLSCCPCPGCMSDCFYLFSTVHEGTLVHTLSMLALWCAKFTSTVPKKLIDWFQKGMTLKQSTSSVRNGYIQCMLAAFKGKFPLKKPLCLGKRPFSFGNVFNQTQIKSWCCNEYIYIRDVIFLPKFCFFKPPPNK